MAGPVTRAFDYGGDPFAAGRHRGADLAARPGAAGALGLRRAGDLRRRGRRQRAGRQRALRRLARRLPAAAHAGGPPRAPACAAGRCLGHRRGLAAGTRACTSASAARDRRWGYVDPLRVLRPGRPVAARAAAAESRPPRAPPPGATGVPARASPHTRGAPSRGRPARGALQAPHHAAARALARAGPRLTPGPRRRPGARRLGRRRRGRRSRSRAVPAGVGAIRCRIATPDRVTPVPARPAPYPAAVSAPIRGVTVERPRSCVHSGRDAAGGRRPGGGAGARRARQVAGRSRGDHGARAPLRPARPGPGWTAGCCGARARARPASVSSARLASGGPAQVVARASAARRRAARRVDARRGAGLDRPARRRIGCSAVRPGRRSRPCPVRRAGGPPHGRGPRHVGGTARRLRDAGTARGSARRRAAARCGRHRRDAAPTARSRCRRAPTPATLAVNGTSAAVAVAGRQGPARGRRARPGDRRRRAARLDGPARLELRDLALDLAARATWPSRARTAAAVDGLGWAPAGATAVRCRDGRRRLRPRPDRQGPHRDGRTERARARRGLSSARVRAAPRRRRSRRCSSRARPPTRSRRWTSTATHVAWAIQDDCQLVADATPADSNLVMPQGPCVRTQVAVDPFVAAEARGDAVGIQFRVRDRPGEALPDPRPRRGLPQARRHSAADRRAPRQRAARRPARPLRPDQPAHRGEPAAGAGDAGVPLHGHRPRRPAAQRLHPLIGRGARRAAPRRR